MLFYIQSIVRPSTPELEKLIEKHRPAHREYVRNFADNIVIRGPTINDDGIRETNIMIAEFDNREAADAWVAEEPLTKIGVFDRIIIKPFDKRFPTV